MSDQPIEPEAIPPRSDIGALIVTVSVLGLFGFTVIASAFGLSVSDGPARLLETAITLVVGYWLGSSNGSRVKDLLMGAMRR